MNKLIERSWSRAPYAIACVGVIGTVALSVLRTVLMPQLWDTDTSRFAANVPAMLLSVAMLILMAVLALHTPNTRIDVPLSRALPTGSVAVLAGITLGITALYDSFRWLVGGTLPAPAQIQLTLLTRLVLYGLLVFGVLGAVVLVRWGLQIVSEGGTRCGMSTFGALAPVMWAWCRLAWYEMSYASTVGWSEKGYDFLVVIFEVLFLFKLARLISGVGKASLGEMLFYAFSTSAFALSGLVVRLCLYFAGNADAYLTSKLVGVADLGLGVLALMFGFALVHGYREEIAKARVEEMEECDEPYDPSLESLVLFDEESDADAAGYNQP